MVEVRAEHGRRRLVGVALAEGAAGLPRLRRRRCRSGCPRTARRTAPGGCSRSPTIHRLLPARVECKRRVPRRVARRRRDDDPRPSDLLSRRRRTLTSPASRRPPDLYAVLDPESLSRSPGACDVLEVGPVLAAEQILRVREGRHPAAVPRAACSSRRGRCAGGCRKTSSTASGATPPVCSGRSRKGSVEHVAVAAGAVLVVAEAGVDHDQVRPGACAPRSCGSIWRNRPLSSRKCGASQRPVPLEQLRAWRRAGATSGALARHARRYSRHEGGRPRGRSCERQ